MSLKIEHKIVDYNILKTPPAADAKASPPAAVADAKPAATAGNKIAHMHEQVERPPMLVGCTYKIKTPVSEHAFYITINDILLNPGTPYEKHRPFEIFINSKNMDHYQWISALTRIISAVFRKGGDVAFLVDELQSIFDPKGGYFRKGGKYVPSLVAEIGDAIETHLTRIGLIAAPRLDQHQQTMLAQARKQFKKQQDLNLDPGEPGEPDATAFPETAVLCGKCMYKAKIMLDNCLTCLNCGDSKCN